LLRDVLYESHFESQFWMIYDTHKSLRGSGDALNISRQKYMCQLEKGDHTVKLHIRHPDYLLLDRIKDISLNVHITLTSAIALDTFSSRTNMFEVDKKKMFPARCITHHATCPVYVAAPPEDKLPKGIKPGEHLLGKISFTTDDDAKKVCTYPLLVSPGPPKASSGAKKDSETKPVEDEYKEAYQDFLASWVSKLDGLDLQGEVLENSADNIVLKNALLNALDESKNRTANLEKIVEISKEIVEMIDEKEILAYTAIKVDASEKSSKNKKDIEKQKEYLINALYKMSLAIADGILGSRKAESSDSTEVEEGAQEVKEPKSESPAAEIPSASRDELNESYRSLLKFVDVNDAKMLMVVVRHGMVHEQYGRAIKALTKYFELNGATKALYEVYIELAQSCEWDHVAKYLQDNSHLKFPQAYELF